MTAAAQFGFPNSSNVHFNGPVFEPTVIPDKISKPAVKATLRWAKKRVQLRTPVHSGNLRSKWLIEDANQRLINYVYYGIFPEIGTFKQKAQYFTRNTVPETNDYFYQQIEKRISSLN